MLKKEFAFKSASVFLMFKRVEINFQNFYNKDITNSIF